MRNKYIDLIDQTYYFLQGKFTLDGDELRFHNIDLTESVHQHGAPLRFMYLPKISENIQRAKKWFEKAIKKHKYEGGHNYCYCTRNSHFKHAMVGAPKNDIHMETSPAFNIDTISNLISEGLINKESHILCNGFKRDAYVDGIADLINHGYRNCIPTIDNYGEIDSLEEEIKDKYSIGTRTASEESPRSEFYTSCLGVDYKNIPPFYNRETKDSSEVRLKILHFSVNTGIKDNAYYWNELLECLHVYIQLKKIAPEFDSLNIGEGFLIKSSLAFEYDCAYMVDEIIHQIKATCDRGKVPVPNIFTGLGSFTVGGAGGAIYEIIHQKQRNDRKKWDMINSSFITTLPDSWAISKRLVLLPISHWDDEYERVLSDGLTCDGDDYCNSEQNMNAIYLPKYNKNRPLHTDLFNTGTYQDSIGGVGGLQHCLIPQPRIVFIDKDKDGKITSRLFMEQQKVEDTLKTSGY